MNGEVVSMREYERKVVLIVNTASKCGFTPQLKELEKLYEKYATKGLVVLGFPCNQFGKQEPGTNEEIEEFCQVNYGVTFTMFQKIEVNGENTHPIYKFLKSETNGVFGDDIKWNFTKFLLNRRGKVVKRIAPLVKPSKIEDEITDLL